MFKLINMVAEKRFISVSANSVLKPTHCYPRKFHFQLFRQSLRFHQKNGMHVQ